MTVVRIDATPCVSIARLASNQFEVTLIEPAGKKPSSLHG